MLYDIITKLKTGKKVFIFYPYKLSNCKVHSMAEIHKMLTDETGKNGEFYNADVDDTKKITLDACCGPFLKGSKKAPTAESMMRSRYSAYVVKNIDLCH